MKVCFCAAFIFYFVFSVPLISCGQKKRISSTSNLEKPTLITALPIVVISTKGKRIPDDNRIVADMGIILNGPGKYNTDKDDFNNFNGKISIEIRGSSSRRFPKKSYSFETLDFYNDEANVSLLGMPPDNDWILYAPYNDKSLMRDVIAYQIARDMGRYASRTAYVELIIDRKYEGVYVLEEKIKQGPHRVPVSGLSKDDTAGVPLTGGYILKIDRQDEGDKLLNRKRITRMITQAPKFFTGRRRDVPQACFEEKSGIIFSGNYAVSPFLPDKATWQTIEFHFEEPDADDISREQQKYIMDFMFDVENAIICSEFSRSPKNYRNLIDVNSFIDYFILTEVTKNIDGYRLSTYFYKDRDDKNGKLVMGPVWDYNISMGNADYCNGASPEGWIYKFNEYCSGHAWLVPVWWQKLLKDPEFTNELNYRYRELRKTTLSISRLEQRIDSIAGVLNEPQQRNFSRWPVLGKYIWSNSKVYNTYNEEVAFLKTWLKQRITWLDNNMPGSPERFAPPPGM